MSVVMNRLRYPVSRLTVGIALLVGATLCTGNQSVGASATTIGTATTISTATTPRNVVVEQPSTTGTGRSVADVSIPAIGLKTPLVHGIRDKDLAKGLGLWPGTGRIGQPGNAVIAGHRTSHTRPLYSIDKLKKGDAIIFRTPQGIAEYRVTKTRIVKPNDMWITRPTKGSTITLFACHPPHSIAYRWVVFAKLHSLTPSKAAKLSV